MLSRLILPSSTFKDGGMKASIEHPNEPGLWTLLDHDGGQVGLWRRDRTDPAPLTVYFVLSPPQQAEIFYSEERARELYSVRAKPKGNRA